MTTARYGLAKQSEHEGDIAIASDDMRCLAVDSAYTPDFATDQFVDDIPAAAILSRSAALTCASVLGVFDCDPFTLPAVTSGKTCNAYVFYKYDASDAAARLYLYKDNSADLPKLANGEDFTVTPDDGANKVFAA